MIIAPKYGWICSRCRSFKEAEEPMVKGVLSPSPELPNGWLAWNLFDEIKIYCSIVCATGESSSTTYTYTLNDPTYYPTYLPRYHRFEKHERPDTKE